MRHGKKNCVKRVSSSFGYSFKLMLHRFMVIEELGWDLLLKEPIGINQCMISMLKLNCKFNPVLKL